VIAACGDNMSGWIGFSAKHVGENSRIEETTKTHNNAAFPVYITRCPPLRFTDGPQPEMSFENALRGRTARRELGSGWSATARFCDNNVSRASARTYLTSITVSFRVWRLPTKVVAKPDRTGVESSVPFSVSRIAQDSAPTMPYLVLKFGLIRGLRS